MRPANNPSCERLLSSALRLVFVLALPALVYCQGKDACADFERTIKATYNFRPALLSSLERDQKSEAMDRVWEMVKSDPGGLLPCLRKALEDPQADVWFRFDGSNLLVSLDPSTASKTLLVRNYAAANLDDVDLRLWVSNLAWLGAEGFDVSDAGARWLGFAKAEYYLPEHGAYKVDKSMGAFFIFCSMDETQATPALLKIASDQNNASREQALALLLFQATPEALQAVKVANKVGRSAKAQAAMLKLLDNPRRFEPRPQPKTSREQFLKAFNAYLLGDGKPFDRLVSEVPDGERDVVAVLRPEDVPLVRRVRRKMIANANQHAFEFYKSFTDILMTLVWRPELVK